MRAYLVFKTIYEITTIVEIKPDLNKNMNIISFHLGFISILNELIQTNFEKAQHLKDI